MPKSTRRSSRAARPGDGLKNGQCKSLSGGKIPVYKITVVIGEFEVSLLRAVEAVSKTSPEEYTKLALVQTLQSDLQDGTISGEMQRILEIAEK